ncbi:MAG: SAM-dependent methyltransferase [Bacillota bacterium]|nr:SAM-dependent methyltransferase [Bacillota bacterium]
MSRKWTVVGLGPGDMDYLSVRALDALCSGREILLRTEQHPCVADLAARGMRYRSFDAVYEESATFDEVYQAIANAVIAEGERSENVVYAVPGNPFVAEKTVEILIERLGREALEIVHGVSFIDAMITCLGIDPVHGLAVIDALDPTAEPVPTLDSIFIQVYDRMTASQLKLRLSEVYGDDHGVILVDSAGISGQEHLVRCTLSELDRAEMVYGPRTSIYVPRSTLKNETIRELMDLIRTLRGENGCPWDQTVTSLQLAQDLVGEAQEVLQAVEQGDVEGVEEELGDVLMLTLFQVILGEEEGYFGLRDVLRGICEKIIRRHPHVFAGEHVSTLEEALEAYNRAKAAEKNEKLRKNV